MRLHLAVAALTLGALAAAAAGGKPNFSGAWILVVARSDFGSSPAPKSMVMKVDHKEPNIGVHSKTIGAQGETSSEYKYVTDGRENSNSVGGREIKSHVYWEGSTLKVSARTNNGNAVLEFYDDWVLSADRKTLTLTRSISAPQGRVQQRYVYEQ